MSEAQYSACLPQGKNKENDAFLDVRDQILTSLMTVSFLFGLPFLASLYFRFRELGGPFVLFLHTFAFFILGILILFRKCISFNVRAWTYLVLFYLASVSGIFKWGLSGLGSKSLVFFVLFGTLLFGIRKGFLMLVCVMVTLVAIFIGVIYGSISFDVDFNTYSTSKTAWIAAIISTALYTSFIIVSFGKLYAFMKSKNESLMDLSEVQKSINENLSESERRFRNLFESAGDAILIIDDGTFIDCNQKTLKIFGCDREYIIGHTPIDISPEFQPGGFLATDKAAEYIHEALAGEEQTFEWKHTRLDGTLFDAEVTLSMLELATGKHLLAIVRDITERKRAELELRQKTAILEAQLNSSIDGILIVDSQGKKVLQNQRTIELWNIPQHIADNEEDAVQLEHVTNLAMHPDKFIEKVSYLYNHPDEISLDEVALTNGTVLERYSAPVLGVDGENYGRIWIFHDITDRIKANRSFKESEEKVRAIFNASSDVMHLIDSEGVILETNTAFSRTSDGEVKSLLGGTNIYDYFHDEAKEFRKNAVMKVFQSGEAYSITDEQTQDRIFQTTIYPVKNEEGNVTAVAVYARNITDQRKAEKDREHMQGQLLQSQKMEAIGQLAGGVAHDFNNMLAIILGSTDLLKSEIDIDDPKYEELLAISQSVERAKDLTLKLLTFARKEKLRNETVKINELIYTTIGILERTLDKKIHVKTVLRDNGIINCDPNQIIQVLINLSNNAADAMPDGGQLTIECSNMKFEDERCGTCGKEFKGHYCLIQVSDTGTGIEGSILNKIFEPFFTTKGVGKGTGLGLAITHGIIEGHNGHLHIYSEEAKGTCVKIYLPLSVYSGEEIKEAEQKDLTGSETVLIVDDEVALGVLCKKLLTKYGYTPILANCGREAIELYKENKNKIDVVILDMIMPDLDGRQVWRALQEINPDVKVIISSGYSVNGQAEDLIREGVQGFVQKPFEQSELFKAIRELMDEI